MCKKSIVSHLCHSHKHSKKQMRQAGSLLTADIQTSFHLIFVLLDLEVAPIQSSHCAVDTQTSFHLISVLLELEVALIQSPHCAD